MTDKIWILGPCAIENEEMFFHSLETIAEALDSDDEWYLKGSFDKANRTSLHGGRGLGLERAVEIWKEAKRRYPQTKFITDVHETQQIERLVGVVDVLQIPAFLCRQTDLIVEAARHFNKINVKKGQWLGPNNLVKSVDKIKETNPDCEAWICDRGSNFGYYDLFVNFGIVDELKQHYDRVILDCTHSIQRSRAVYGTQGDRVLAERYFTAADLFNYDGVFAEVHPNPSSAISDGDCQLHLEDLETLVAKAKKVGEIA
jgi:2-dehydro-3-deoxyphosphooctonate aldolase (KDO 8-P synthase)